MLLSAIFLVDVGGVNNYQESQSLSFTSGDQTQVYFQLRDMSVFPATAGYKNPGRRYMPAAGATLTVTIPSLDPSKKIAKICSQPFASDPSIWSFIISSNDQISGTQDVLLSLSESGVITRGIIQSGLRAYPSTPVPCSP